MPRRESASSRQFSPSDLLVTAKVDVLLQLRQMLDTLVNGRDRSLRHANDIESMLLENFAEDDGFEDLLVALASYRPGGGEYLYDEASIRRVVSEALAEIESRLTRAAEEGEPR